MPHVTIQGSGLRFALPEFRKALEEDLYEAMLKVAVVWTRTALHCFEGGAFPVITGMARASFANLVRFLDEHGKHVAFDLTANVQYERTTPLKNVTRGIAQSKKSNFIVVLKNQYGPFKYRFEWFTDVEHFKVNEVDPGAQKRFGLIHPTPWLVSDQANEAAKNYIPTAMRQVRGLENFVSYTSWEVK